jgi:hypothetical protein
MMMLQSNDQGDKARYQKESYAYKKVVRIIG